MENEADNRKKRGPLSKALGLIEMGVAGAFSSARYVRGVASRRVWQALSLGHVSASEAEAQRIAAVRRDLYEPESVLGKAYQKARQSAPFSMLTPTAEAEEKLATLTGRKLPFINRATGRGLHLSGGEKTKAGLVFAAVGSIAGFAVYTLASSLRHEEGRER